MKIKISAQVAGKILKQEKILVLNTKWDQGETLVKYIGTERKVYVST